MAATLEKVDFEISAIDKASAVIKNVQGAMGGMANSVATVQKAFAGLTVALGVVAFKGVIDKVAEANAKLDDFAERTGASVEQLSRLSQIAKIGGNDMEGVVVALEKLSKGMAGADEETKGAGAALAYLGVQAKDSTGKYRDTGEVLFEVADKLSKYADGAGKTALAQALLGKSGAQLLPVLKDMAEMGDVVAKVNANQAATAEEYGKNQRRLAAVSGSYVRMLAQEAIPVMTAFSGALIEQKQQSDKVGESLKALQKDNTIAEWAENAGLAVAHLVDVLRAIPSVIQIVGKATGAVLADTINAGKVVGGLIGGGLMGKAYGENKTLQEGLSYFRNGGAGAEFKGDMDRIAQEFSGNSFVDKFKAQLERVRNRRGEKLPDAGFSTAKDGKDGKDKGISFDELLARNAQKRLQLQEQAEQDAERLHQQRVQEEIRANEQAYESARRLNEQLDKEAQSYRELLDPTLKYYEQIQRIDELLEKGKLTEQEAVDARLKMVDQIQDAAKKMADMGNAAEDNAKFGRQMGLTFESAFEKIALSGSKARDVVLALGNDLGRIILRRSITEPLGNSATSILDGLFATNKSGPNLAKGLDEELRAMVPSYDVGTSYVPRDGLAYIHQGEQIIPAGRAGGAPVINITLAPSVIDGRSFAAWMTAPDSQRVIVGVMAKAARDAGISR